jgi:two-component sensor histidine kinase
VISPVDKVKLHWWESDGPSVDTPQHAGFGSTLIEKGICGADRRRGHAAI